MMSLTVWLMEKVLDAAEGLQPCTSALGLSAPEFGPRDVTLPKASIYQSVLLLVDIMYISSPKTLHFLGHK